MKKLTIRYGVLFTVAIALATLATWPAGVRAQFQTTPTTFSGRAVAISGTVAGFPITLVDTGPVQPSGEALEEHLLCYPDGPNCTVGLPDVTGGALTSEVLSATVVAQGDHSRAAASVANLTVNAAGQSISASLVQARADAQCATGSAFVRAESEIAELVINGQTIAVTGDVNQRVDLPGGGAVLINEQTASVAAGNGDTTVNALHIKIPGPVPGTDTDVIIAQAHADIQCGQRVCPQDNDFVTGGGWIGNPKQNFAVAGGIKNGAFWGHLLFIDHGTGVKIKGTGVTAYTITGTTTRRINGTCEINGLSGTYEANVDDEGEPGVGKDSFSLSVNNGVPIAAGMLGGGNIQLHTCR